MTPELIADARADVIEAADWYDRTSPGEGDRFLAAVDRTKAMVAVTPHGYGRVDRCPRGREIRERLVDGYPYRFVYEVTATEIRVLSITHARRKAKPWRGRLRP